jgi:peptidoglycan/LPS O-acetylase OafA/YrhL
VPEITMAAGSLGVEARASHTNPDRTADGKEHFEVLDGLRGSAAMLVVLFHIQGITVAWDGAKVILHHAPLAVDFFFALSGFVIGYAYDDRWPDMTAGQFLKLRLIRLHPLVILGVLLGFVSYLFDPLAGSTQAAPLYKVVVALILGLLLIPAGALPNRWSDTHPLNGPCWSLLQEYIGNLAYAFLLRHLSSRVLGSIAVASGAVLIVCAGMIGTLDQDRDGTRCGWHRCGSASRSSPACGFIDFGIGCHASGLDGPC